MHAAMPRIKQIISIDLMTYEIIFDSLVAIIHAPYEDFFVTERTSNRDYFTKFEADSAC